MNKKAKIGRPKIMSEETMAKLLYGVFAEKGYAATTIADLTKATGMKPASLYLAFGSKEGMYVAALNYYRSTWLSGLQNILEDKTQTFESRMRAFLQQAFAIFSCEGKPPGCMMTFSALAFQENDNELACRLLNERRDFMSWLEKEAESAKESGQLPESITPKIFAQLIVTLERGLALSAIDKPDRQTVQSMIDDVLTLVFQNRVSTDPLPEQVGRFS